MESTKPKFRKPYRAIERNSLVPQGESRTKQAFADQCEINNIINKFQATGAITHANKHQLHYGETDGTTFHEAMNIVCEAQEAFSELPSSLRNRFGNDPAAYLDFVSNEENKPEMARLGLLTPTAAEEALLPSRTLEITPEGGTVDPT